MKRSLIKYGLLLLCLIPILLVVNYFLKTWNSWAVIGIDVAIGVVVIGLISFSMSYVEKKKAVKRKNAIEKMAEEKAEEPKKENLGIKKYPTKITTKKKGK